VWASYAAYLAGLPRHAVAIYFFSVFLGARLRCVTLPLGCWLGAERRRVGLGFPSRSPRNTLSAVRKMLAPLGN